nr:hypothetical protein [Tanacetum cinerariifolium]
MASLADKAILSGADNRPPILEKDMYDSWKSRMKLYMLNRQHGRMILGSVEQGQDRKNITKTSAMPHEALLRVTSLGGGKGRGGEKALLRRMLQTQGVDQREDLLDRDKSADKGSDSTDEMSHLLGTLEAVNILAIGGLRRLSLHVVVDVRHYDELVKWIRTTESLSRYCN